MSERRRLVVGCMSGTSLDAIDSALVEVRGDGLGMAASLVAFSSRPLGELGVRLRALAEGERLTAHDHALLAHDLGEAHGEGVTELVSGNEKPSLVAAHGQTIFHAPPLSTQLLDPWPIARRLGCPVVSDLRGADLTAGGQGAPITPLADWILFRSADEPRAIVNLGGFCNTTVIPAGAESDSVHAADVCACNLVLDAVARRALGAPFDEGGQRALAGTPSGPATAELVSVLAAQSTEGRSLGTGDEAFGWIDRYVGELTPDDLAASAAAGVGRTIGSWVRHEAVDARVHVAGGGSRNAALLRGIQETCETVPSTTEAIGIPAEAREAAAMAVLGALAADGVPITLRQVTHRSPAVPSAGAWTNLGAMK